MSKPVNWDDYKLPPVPVEAVPGRAAVPAQEPIPNVEPAVAEKLEEVGRKDAADRARPEASKPVKPAIPKKTKQVFTGGTEFKLEKLDGTPIDVDLPGTPALRDDPTRPTTGFEKPKRVYKTKEGQAAPFGSPALADRLTPGQKEAAAPIEKPTAYGSPALAERAAAQVDVEEAKKKAAPQISPAVAEKLGRETAPRQESPATLRMREEKYYPSPAQITGFAVREAGEKLTGKDLDIEELIHKLEGESRLFNDRLTYAGAESQAAALADRNKAIEKAVQDHAARYGTNRRALEMEATSRGIPLTAMIEAYETPEYDKAVKPASEVIAAVKKRGVDLEARSRVGNIDINWSSFSPQMWESETTTGVMGTAELPHDVEVVKPGERGYETALQVWNAVEDDGYNVGYITKLAGERGGATKWVQQRVEELSAGVNSADPDYDAKKMRAWNRAVAEIAAFKTIGLWASPIFMNDLIAPDYSATLTDRLWSAVKGQREVVGYGPTTDDNKPRIITRAKSTPATILDAIDIPQQAVVGFAEEVAEKGWDQADFAEGAVKGIEDRRDAMTAALQSDWAKPTQVYDNFGQLKLDENGQPVMEGTWKPVVAGGLGFAVSVLFPDMTLYAGKVGSVGADAYKGLRDARRMNEVNNLLEGVIASRVAGATALRDAEKAKADFRAAVARNAPEPELNRLRAAESESRQISRAIFDSAAEQEAKLRGKYKMVADDVDRMDSQAIQDLARDNPDVFNENLARAASHSDELVTMHPSLRRMKTKGEVVSDIRAKKPAEVSFVDYDQLFNTGKIVRTIDEVLGDAVSAEVVTKVLRTTAANDIAAIARVAGDDDIAKALVADIENTLGDAVADPKAWANGILDRRNQLPAINPADDATDAVKAAAKEKRAKLVRSIVSIYSKAKAAKLDAATDIRGRAIEAALTNNESRIAAASVMKERLGSMRQSRKSRLKNMGSDSTLDMALEKADYEPNLTTSGVAFKKMLVEAGLSEKQAQVAAIITDARARVASWKRGISTDEWYATRIEGVVKGEAAGFTADALYQEALAANVDVSKLAVPEGFFSPLQRAIAKVIGDNNGKPVKSGYLLQQVKKQTGVKADELQWSGLEEFLQGKERVSLEEVTEWLTKREPVVEVKGLGLSRQGSEQARKAANRLAEADRMVSETGSAIAGFAGDNARISDLYDVSLGDTREIAKYIYELTGKEWDGPTGGVSFHNVGPKDRDDAARRLVEAGLSDEYIRMWKKFEAADAERLAASDALNKIERGDDETQYERYVAPGPSENYREIRFIQPAVQSAGGQQIMHFEPNAIAHLRVTDRTTEDGKKVLFVEEVQSDWHQAGAKEGYWTAEKQAELDALEANRLDVEGELGSLRSEFARSLDGDLRRWRDMADNLVHSRASLEARVEMFGLPKDKTTRYLDLRDVNVKKAALEAEKAKLVSQGAHAETWRELALKQALIIAAREGYDGVAMTRGPIIARVAGGSGVGGELPGQLSFYEEILPNTAASLAKKNGSRLETTRLNVGAVVDDEKVKELREHYAYLNSSDDAKRLAAITNVGSSVDPANLSEYERLVRQRFPAQRRIPELIGSDAPATAWKKTDNGVSNVPYIPVTDAMKAKVESEGLPLFSRDKTHWSSYFSDNAISEALAESSGNSRTAIVYMTPAEFLSLAEEGVSERKTANTAKVIDDGGKWEDLPQLNVDEKPGASAAKVGGHEGRHRARYLASHGIEKMPVRVRMSQLRWRSREREAADWPKTLLAEKGSTSLPFPTSAIAANGELADREPKTLFSRDTVNTPAFKKWFGGSKVVDESGKPLVVYHTTEGDFEAFNTTPHEGALGSHFGDKETANQVSRASLGKGTVGEPVGAIMPVYLSLKNPLRVPDGDNTALGTLKKLVYAKSDNVQLKAAADKVFSTEEGKKLFAEYNNGDLDKYDLEEDVFNAAAEPQELKQRVIKALNAAGYDGLVYKNYQEGGRVVNDSYTVGDSYVVFSPAQVKSVHNSGAFNPQDPRLLYSRDRITPDALGDLKSAIDKLKDNSESLYNDTMAGPFIRLADDTLQTAHGLSAEVLLERASKFLSVKSALRTGYVDAKVRSFLKFAGATEEEIQAISDAPTTELRKLAEHITETYHQLSHLAAKARAATPRVYTTAFEADRGWMKGGLKSLEEAKTARDAAVVASKYAESPAHRHIAAKLSNIVEPDEAFEIRVSDPDRNRGHRAYAESSTRGYTPGATVMFRGGENLAAEGYLSSETLLHELVHAATAQQIKRYRDASPHVALTPQARAAVEDLDRLYVHAVAEIGRSTELAGVSFDRYGLTNLQEFVSEALSDPTFQRVLKQLPAERSLHGRTVWDSFVEKLRIILGLDTQEASALDQILDASARLIDTSEETHTALRSFDRTEAAETNLRNTIELLESHADEVAAELENAKSAVSEAVNELDSIRNQRDELGKAHDDFIDNFLTGLNGEVAPEADAYRQVASAHYLTPETRAKEITIAQRRIAADAEAASRADIYGWAGKQLEYLREQQAQQQRYIDMISADQDPRVLDAARQSLINAAVQKGMDENEAKSLLSAYEDYERSYNTPAYQERFNALWKAEESAAGKVDELKETRDKLMREYDRAQNELQATPKNPPAFNTTLFSRDDATAARLLEANQRATTLKAEVDDLTTRLAAAKKRAETLKAALAATKGSKISPDGLRSATIRLRAEMEAVKGDVEALTEALKAKKAAHADASKAATLAKKEDAAAEKVVVKADKKGESVPVTQARARLTAAKKDYNAAARQLSDAKIALADAVSLKAKPAEVKALKSRVEAAVLLEKQKGDALEGVNELLLKTIAKEAGPSATPSAPPVAAKSVPPSAAASATSPLPAAHGTPMGGVVPSPVASKQYGIGDGFATEGDLGGADEVKRLIAEKKIALQRRIANVNVYKILDKDAVKVAAVLPVAVVEEVADIAADASKAAPTPLDTSTPSTETVAKVEVDGQASTSPVDASRVEPAAGVVEGPNLPRGAVTFADDGRAIIHAFEGANVETFLHEVGHIMRRDLDADEVGDVVDWLRAQTGDAGLDIVDGRLIATDATTAEELFAEGFTAYLRTGVSPTPNLQRAFDYLKSWLREIYKTVRGFFPQSVTPETAKMFDKLLSIDKSNAAIAKAMRSGIDPKATPGIIKRAYREMIGPALPQAPKTMDELAKAAQASGIDTTAEKLEAIMARDGKIDFPTPVAGRASYTDDDLKRFQATIERARTKAREEVRLKQALSSPNEAVTEASPTEALRNRVSGDGDGSRVARFATSLFIGLDADLDLRAMPAHLRAFVKVGARNVEAAYSDGVKLLAERAPDKFRQWLAGRPTKFENGRNAISSGHDMAGAVRMNTRLAFSTLGDKAREGAERAAFSTTSDAVARLGVDSRELVSKAVVEVLYATNSDFLKQLGEVLDIPGRNAGIGVVTEPRPQEVRLTGALQRFAHVDSDSLLAVDDFLDIVEDVYGSDKAARVGLLIAGHGAGHKAIQKWYNAGLTVSPKEAMVFQSWLHAEKMSPEDFKKAQATAEKFGLDPRFVPVSGQFGTIHVPEAARKRLAAAMAKPTQDSLNWLSSPNDIGRGIYKDNVKPGQAAYDTVGFLTRGLKAGMTRGNLLVSSWFNFANLIDRSVQVSIKAGLGAAFAVSTRVMAQDLLIFAPFVSRAADIGRRYKVFGPEVIENMRRELSRGGDRMSVLIQKMALANTCSISTNKVLDGVDETVNLGGRWYNYKDLRQVYIDQGVSSSYAGELDNAIRKSLEPPASLAEKLGDRLASYMEYVEEMHEGLAERERVGAMITFIEMGASPEDAARLAVAALFDYGSSIAAPERSAFLAIFFPFLAFQKNANVFTIDSLLSPWGAYRVGVVRRMWEGSTEALSEVLYGSVADPYGMDTRALSDTGRANYYALRAELEAMYGGSEHVPDDIKLALRHLFGQLPAYMMTDGKISELSAKLQSAVDMSAQPDFRLDPLTGRPGMLDIAEAYVPRPNQATGASYNRERPVITMTYPKTEAMKRYLSLANDDHPFTELMLPENTIVAGLRHVLNLAAATILLPQKLAAWATAKTGDDLGQDPEWFGIDETRIAGPLTQVMDPDRSLLLPEISADLLGGAEAPPYRIHPFLGKTFEAAGLPLMTVGAQYDPFGLSTDATPEAEAENARLMRNPTWRGRDSSDKNIAVISEKRYYTPGGLWSIACKRTPGFHDLNRLLLAMDQTTLEDAGGLRGDLMWAASAILNAPVAENLGDKSAAREEPRKKDEVLNPNK